MNLQEARTKLHSTTFLIGGFQQSAALKYLAETAEPEAVEILTAALDSHAKSAEIERILLEERRLPKVTRLWRLWNNNHDQRLGGILKKIGLLPEDVSLVTVATLKLGVTGNLRTDLKTVRNAIAARNTDDDTKAAFSHYLTRLKKEAPQSHTAALLLLGEFAEIGFDRGGASRILPFVTTDDADLKKQRDAFVAKLTPEALTYLKLASGAAASLPIDRTTVLLVADYCTDQEAPVKAGAAEYQARVQTASGELSVLFLSKLGKIDEIPKDLGTARKAIELVEDPDAAVSQGILNYLKGLPVKEEFNDLLCDAWLRLGHDGIAKIIASQKRKSSNPAKEALICLLNRQVDDYLKLESGSGDLLMEAYSIASEAQRGKLKETVMQSGNTRLTSYYQQATMHRTDYDAEAVLAALKKSGDDKELFKASGQMTLPDLLELCAKWAKSSWRPANAEAKMRVERALAAFKKIGSLKIEAETVAPPGTTDLFTWWRQQNLSDSDIRQQLTAEDPFDRAGALYLGALKGILPAGRLDQAATSEDWPERLIARMFNAGPTPAAKDHVEWVNVCAGSGELISTPVDCTPVEHEHIGSLIAGIPATATGTAGKYRALLEILHAFQSLYVSGRIVVSRDDSAEDVGAVELEDAPL